MTLPKEILEGTKTIAIIGLSDKPDRYSHQVAAYLQKKGYRIIPINPSVTEVLGERAYPTLHDVPRDITIDVIDVFRKPEFVPTHVMEAVQRGDVHTVWLQEGVTNRHAEEYAREHGLHVVSDMCMMKVHKDETS